MRARVRAVCGKFYPPPPRRCTSRQIAIAFLLIALAVALVGINPSPAAAQSTTDYDDDNDGLIDVRTLAQLNAIRWDLNGDGVVASTDAANYLLAFPNRDTNSATRMGCPSGACTGYELRADLDFDTDDDGDVDSDDEYPVWDAIFWGTSYYGVEFKGNNHTISNLTIARGRSFINRFGLFGGLSSTGSISGVGLEDVNIYLPFAAGFSYVGALVAESEGTVRSSYATGSISVTTQDNADIHVGGLVGSTWGGTIAASWSRVDVSATSTGTINFVNVGGLVGRFSAGRGIAEMRASYATGSVTGAAAGTNRARVGGLVGLASSESPARYRITASYSTGAVSVSTSNSNNVGGSAGSRLGIDRGANSYWDTTTTGIADDFGTHTPEGKTTSELQSVLSYTGIYANWNVNVDGVSGNDDPWDFGTNSQYPRLKFGGMNVEIQSTIDYDDDDDGLIDVKTLAQLNAMRWDLNGDGDVASGDAANYLAAFPNRDTAAASRMGCPSGTCTGYELRADLDFDTDTDGDVDSSDAYASWTPIGTSANPYTAEFKGNNNTISNLTMSGTTTLVRAGLFGQLSSAASVSGVGLVDVNLGISMPTASHAGALVGFNEGTVRSSYATGVVSATTTSSAISVGGLAGTTGSGTIAACWSSVAVSSSASTTSTAGGLTGSLTGSTGNDVSIIASYATGSVSITGSATTSRAGGLVGNMSADGTGQATITASYATGAASVPGGGSAGGLVGVVGSGTTTITDGYWDTTTTSIADDADTTSPEGKTTSDLQSVLSYTGIYANWNVNVDGTAGNDDPWDFGTNMQYPRLKFGGMSLTAQVQPTDYDDDDDGLIDVTTLAQLNAMRWDLNGDGYVLSVDAANYLLAFPNRSTGDTTRMGCPSGTCAGYELRADLDFDTDDDGDVDSNDDYPSWTQIGGQNDDDSYASEFKGNNHTISNLTMSDTRIRRVGLFGRLSATGVISGVGLVDVNIDMTRLSGHDVGALVGFSEGTVRSSYSTGSISWTPTSSRHDVGGLIGQNWGTIAASWSSADVSVASPFGNTNVGGLVGHHAGGLVSSADSSIIASYATGSVSVTGSSSFNRVGGLVGRVEGSTVVPVTITASYATGPVSAPSASSATTGAFLGAIVITSGLTITNSYWDTGTTDIADDSDTTAPEGKTTSDLHSVLSYTGIYANWNVNVDGVTGNDDPWEFGANMQYPLLKFDGMSQVAQGSLAMGTPGTNGDNPVVGQMASVCLSSPDRPAQRAAGSGGVGSYKLWVWSKSTDAVSWTNITEDGGRSYEYTPVSGDVGSYLRACVALDSTLSSVEGAEEACVHPFAKVKASN